MPLTQHYRVYKGGLPHAVFRTDYMARLRSLLPSPEGSDPPPETEIRETHTSFVATEATVPRGGREGAVSDGAKSS